MKNKKFFAVLAIAEIFIILAWLMCLEVIESAGGYYMFTAEGQQVLTPAYITHLVFQGVMLALFCALTIHYTASLKPAWVIFAVFIGVVYVTTFGLLVTIMFQESLFVTWAYVTAGAYMWSLYVTLAACVARYMVPIYKRLSMRPL